MHDFSDVARIWRRVDAPDGTTTLASSSGYRPRGFTPWVLWVVLWVVVGEEWLVVRCQQRANHVDSRQYLLQLLVLLKTKNTKRLKKTMVRTRTKKMEDFV